MPQKEEELPDSAAQMQATLESLARSNRLKDELLARLSHDLRTPLGAILGWANALQMKPVGPGVLERGLDAISRNVATQARLLDELLEANQILSGKLVLEQRPVDIATVVAAAIHQVRPSAEAKDLRLEAPFDPPAVTIAGDPGRLQQAVANLLVNAVELTPRGGRIEVLLQRGESELELTVRDDGIGMDAALLAQVFDPLRPPNESSPRVCGGLGLGLPISRQLVELHGGSIEATSVGPGAGASFVIRLPISRPV